VLKWALLSIAKLPMLTKIATIAAVAVTTAAIAGLPIHDVWFDYALFIVFSSIVSGMPEPDTQLSLPRFIYTWAFRSAHLLVASATAYFIHQKKWEAISEPEKTSAAGN
jgi:hypothetical protein